MDKLERIACLYLSFLNSSSKGLSFARLRRLMPSAYEGDFESARRKFERDKEELKKLGLELKYYPHRENYLGLEKQNEEEEHIYIPCEEIRKMPDIELGEIEYKNLSALILKALAKGKYNSSEKELLYSAASKLFYKNPALLLEGDKENENKLKEEWKRYFTESPDTEEFLEKVHYALQKQKAMNIRYSDPKNGKKGEERLVSGRGLISHRGRWCLLAYCNESKDIRHFYVDRILSLEIREKGYCSDPNFDIHKYSLHPLKLKIHPLKKIELKLRPEYVEHFSHFLGENLKRSSPEAYSFEEGVFHFQTSNQFALFAWMLRNVDAVEKIAPPLIQKEYANYIEKIKMNYASL